MSYRVLSISQNNDYFTVENYETAKNSYDGVVLRVGYRDPLDGSLNTDTKFANHYNGFSNSNCKIGAYWETNAITIEEAVEEASYVYNIIKNLDSKLAMPVYVWSKQSAGDNSGRADLLDDTTRTSCLIAFADALHSHMYNVGLMASENWIRTQIIPDVIIPGSEDDPDSPNYSPKYTYHIDLEQWNYYLWIISLGVIPTMKQEEYDSWMYTDSALMTGYTGTVSESNFFTNVAGWDLQVKDLSELSITVNFGEDDKIFNTKPHTPEVIVVDETNTLVLNTHYTVNYIDNINAGIATIKITGIPENGYDGVVEKTFEIIRRDITEEAILTCDDPDENLYYNFDNFAVFCNGTRLTDEIDYTLTYVENIVEHDVEFKTLIVPDVIIPGSEDDPDSPNYVPKYDIRIEHRTDVIAKTTVKGIGNYSGEQTQEFNLRSYEYPASRIDIQNLFPSLSETNYFYNGKPNKPAINIRNDDYLLIEGKDYNVTYADNVDVGEAIAIITGIYDYTGEVTKVFNILPTSIESATVTCGTPDHRGSYNLDNLHIRIDAMNLDVPSSDYTYITNVETLDKYVITTLTITGRNNFTGVLIAQIQTGYIEDPSPEGTDINDVEFALETSNYEFKENTEFRPGLRLYKINGSDLIEGQDYQAIYSNNKNAGIAKITVIGIGNFYGSREITFMISPKDLTNKADITSGSADENGVYDLTLIEVRVDNYILTRNIDYHVILDPQQTDFEVKTVVSIIGINNYTGIATKSFKTEQIVVNMKNITVKLESESEEFVYTGEVINPKVLVGFQVPEYIEPPEVIIPGSEWDPEAPGYVDPNHYEITEPIMEEGKDYKIDYVKSINHGIYYVTVTGLGNYEGIKTARYKIIPRSIDDAIINCGEAIEDAYGRFVYDINNLRVIVDGKSLVQAVDYQFTADESDTDEDGYPNTKVTVVAQDNYTGTREEYFITDKRNMYPGKTIHLEMATIYPRYGTLKSNIVKSGTFYLWDDKVVNNRIRITNNYLGIKKLGYLTGWIDTSLLLEKIDFELGDEVVVKGMLNQYADGSGNTLAKDNIIMYIVDILDKDQFEYPYGLASAPNRNRVGWAKPDMIKWYEQGMVLHPEDDDY